MSDMRPSPSWGPGERLAIPWYRRVPTGCQSCDLDWFITFVDGRTLETSEVHVPGGMRLLPEWAADGSGMVVEVSERRQVLHPDGSTTPADTTVENCVVTASSGARLSATDGVVTRAREDGVREIIEMPANVRLACFSPDGVSIMVAMDPAPDALITSWPEGDTSVADLGLWRGVDGAFAGWMEMGP